MRKSFVALALLVGAATMLTTLAFAQEPEGQAIVKSPRMRQVTKAARLGTSADADTMYVGHTTTGTYSEPWHVGVALSCKPGVGGKYDGMWDFDTYDNAATPAESDSAQGWVPGTWTVVHNTGSPLADGSRPWRLLDYGNRMNARPVQKHTLGIVSAWHADDGNYAPLPNSWTALAGSKSAWCGLRADGDFSAIDDTTYGGTGNAISGNALFGNAGTVTNYGTARQCLTNFPGYANQWDQMLYRDVRITAGQPLKVEFLYETQMDNTADQSPNTGGGWLDRDPLSMQQGGEGLGKNNFISNSLSPGRLGPIDSFMVYVGVPANPDSVRLTNGAKKTIFDLKRRWFSEVIAIDKPYMEILSTFGRDSAYKTSAYTATVIADSIDRMITAQGGVGGGVIRVVFRIKTNLTLSDETNAPGAFISTNKGAVRIDNVVIKENVTTLVNSTFESAGEINNKIEPANTASPGPNVGQGYALDAWHGTGKPPNIVAHLHPLFAWNGNPKLEFLDPCGDWNSPYRIANFNNVVVSMTDHNLLEGSTSGNPALEQRQSWISPVINFVTPAMPGVNSCGLDEVHVNTDQGMYIWYDVYSGLLSSRAEFANFMFGTVMCYPVLQRNGAQVWSGVRNTGGYDWGSIYSYSTVGDAANGDEVSGLLYTSNPSGMPDSIRLVIHRYSNCIAYSATACANTMGLYLDNITLGIVPPITGGGGGDKVTVSIFNWYNDAFPRNESVLPDPLSPGCAAFDTCGALIATASNAAALGMDPNRPNIHADSVAINGVNGSSVPMRMDCVFRVYPGPGNYMTAGNRSSGLRRVPSPVPIGDPPTLATANDGSFWGQYMQNPGDVAPFNFNKGTHAGGVWNVDTWNSVRCDTLERNLFPETANHPNLPGFAQDWWQTTIHELDPNFTALGILKNRCFLVDPGPGTNVDNTNITCVAAPGWANAAAGYDGVLQTREYTKIFPDGLLTPGSSIQYFLRLSKISDPGVFVMQPDTNRVSPQPNDLGQNTDGTRWQTISILPDRWKDNTYTSGSARAAMLVVDMGDRRGNERVWAGIADSIGATAAAKYGAQSGWHCQGGYLASDGSSNYTNETNCGTDPNIRVWGNGGQPGSMWDLYNVKGAGDSPTGVSTSIGGRLAAQGADGYLGDDVKMSPTPDMLIAYYNLLFFLCGDAGDGGQQFFGITAQKSADDITVVDNFLTGGGERGVWFMGRSVVEGITGVSDQHDTFLSTTLGVFELRAPSFFIEAGVRDVYPDLIPSEYINAGAPLYTVANSCFGSTDVLVPNALVGAVAGSTYGVYGDCLDCIASVYTPNAGDHLYTTLVDGWDIVDLYNQGGGSSLGRLRYFMDVMTNVFGGLYVWEPAPTVDVGLSNEADAKYLNLLGNMGNNPLTVGMATVNFSLAKSDLVDVKVFDVTGRLVKTLASRQAFKAGPNKLAWDGRNDQGQVVSRGVYFTQVKFINSGFVDAKKVTILK